MTDGGVGPSDAPDPSDPPGAAEPRPLPALADEPYAEPFWAGAREGELRLQWCTDCGDPQFFPRPWCRFCGSEALEWRVASGEGTVYAYTVVRRVVQEPAFAGEIPYVLAYVDLAEGPRMFTALVDCDPADVENGMPVVAVFDRVTDEVALPKFRPTGPGAGDDSDEADDGGGADDHGDPREAGEGN